MAKLDGPDGSGRLLILLDVERMLADHEQEALPTTLPASLPQGKADALDPVDT